ncbi:leucine-rich repeat domain-containing protein [Aquimarina latercula]|uniref:leucine-rich repeat domain-containing protein n=1 Tax=Aquimarina latercula TaxID=987 RepID=UPI0005543713|nr:leucine-rich repeat domain-containing protein [Aquimarina latercula]
MKTKITTFIFTFFAILTGIAQTTFTDGDLNYEVISAAPALAKVTGTDIPLGTPLNINIPTTASDGATQFDIVSVGNGAFKDATIVTLSFSNTIITIEQEAFENSGLTTVTIPNSVTTIERDAFRQNSITSLDLGEGVTALGIGAFNFNQLVSITLPASVSTIEDSVFRNNPLETITVEGNTPPTTNNNGSNENSFGDRSNIVVTVPTAAKNDYLNSPDWEDFFSINGQYTGPSNGEFTVGGFTYRVIEGGVPNTAEVIDTSLSGAIVIPAEFTVNTISFVVTGINNFGLNNIEGGLTSVILPNTITIIELGAFEDNVELTTITIPNSVTTIEDRAFRNTSLETVIVDATQPPTTAAESFGTRTNINVTVPPAAVNTYLADANWEDFYSINGQYTGPLEEQFTTGGFTYEITAGGVPNTVKVFSTTLSGAIEIPAQVLNNTITFVPTAIEKFGLNNIDGGLTSVILPNTITIIEEGAFEDNQLTSVTIPESVTTIEDRAFNQNTSLETVIVAATQPPTTAAESFGTRTNINVTVPPAALQDYLDDANWEDFFSINGQYTGVVPFEFDKDGFSFRIFDASQPNNVLITGNTNSGTIIIPETVVENTLTFVPTRIGDNAFFDDGVTAVTLPNTITRIDNNAFANNALTTVTIPNTITRISDNAFASNALTTVSIPSNVRIIDPNAFANNSLTSLHIEERSNDVNLFIDANAFMNNQLTDITFPEFPAGVVINLKDDVFVNNSLETVRVEANNSNQVSFNNSNPFGDRSNINLLVPGAALNAYLNDGDWDGFFSTNEQYTGPIPLDFEQDGITYTITSAGDTNTVSATNTNLRDFALTIPDVLTERTIDFVPTVIGDFSFNGIRLTSVSLPNTITTIEEGAFEDNPLITTVTIPENVTTIEARAFNQNTSLETVTVTATQPPTTAADSFGTRTNINVTVPDAAENDYLNSADWEDFFSINGQYTGPLGEDGEFTVDGIRYRVTEGGIPNTVTVVSTNLSGALTIPGVVTENTVAFVPTIIFRFSLNDKGLTSVSIPNTITTIEEGAFEDNGNLTTITIPNSVTTIEGRAFRNNGLTTLNLGEGVETLGQGAFQNNPLTTVTIPDSVTLIESDAFRSNNLATVDLGEGVVELGTAAFFSNELTDITIPASVTTLADNVFTSNQLETITVAANQPPTVTSSSFGTRTDIAVTVPNEALATYLNDTNWEDFFSINGQYTGALGEEFTVDGIKYRITAGGVLNTVAVVSTTNSGIIIIPESVTENTVAFEPTTIIDLALNGQSINSLSLPNTIVSIGERAFQDNDLTTVTIPDSVTEIGDNAFDTNELQTLVLGANLETLGVGAFNFNQLTAITLPAGITAIGRGTFRNNPLETITVLGSVPPTTNNNGATENSFGDRSDIVVTVPTAAENDYLNSEFWTGFFSINGQYTGALGNEFTVGGIKYRITASGIPNTVTAVETELTGALTIPEVVTENTIGFVPTVIQEFGFNMRSLTSVSLPNTITIIEEGAFEDNDLTSVTIPESVTTIEARAFNLNRLLETVTVDATQPPTTADRSFGTRTNINVTVPPAAVDTYLADANWENFYSINGQYTGALGERFTTGGFTYEITAGGVPNTVKVFSTTLSGAIEIPEQVLNNTITFIPTAIEEFGLNNEDLTAVSLPNTIITIGRGAFEDNDELTSITIPNSVTTIEERAFRNNGLTTVDLGEGLVILGQSSFQNNPNLSTVTIPNSVTEIGVNAFRDNGLITVNLGEGLEILGEGAFFNNQLTDIIIPTGVTTIETSAFRNNPLTSVTVLATVPPTTDSSSSENSFGDRSGIDLFVPEGTPANYILSGQWDGFNSINGVINIDITLALKVFLQGATINPNAGEEDLMRDDLRVAGLIPTTSPYSDGLTLDATVFDITGNNGIVDWVFVQLRDPNDASIVIEEKSALLQRDGDIVNTSGSSSLSFTLDEDDYFISIEHRNHLGILSANAITLSAAPTVIDFTADLSVTQGGINALVEISEGKFAMVAGDFDENGQVQPTDVSDTTSAIGTSAYSNADMDMNGQIQPADINNLVNPNVGRGEQLLARSTLATSTGKGTHKHIEFRYAPKAQAANKQPSEGIHVKF